MDKALEAQEDLLKLWYEQICSKLSVLYGPKSLPLARRVSILMMLSP